jgi:hypothetical protein
MTIEQFLACNCVGLELSHARPGTRRFEDGRVILALSAALQSMPWRACRLVGTVGATRCRRGMFRTP